MENSYSIFQKEIKVIQELYSETIKSYNFYYTEIHKDENWKKTKGLKSNLEYNLRELLHIRLISILEIYLVDNVRFILTKTKVPLKNQSVIEIQFQELISYKSLTELWNKIINKECRRLSSEGFEKILKYYKLKFKIDLFSVIPSKNKMFEFHDRRHLFVHKLGKTDAEYRKKYNTTKNGLSISEDYLIEVIEHLLLFGGRINGFTSTYLQDCIEDSKTIQKHPLNINLKLIDDFDQIEKFKKDYSFWFQDKLFVISELVESFEISKENKLTINFFSTVDSEVIKYYFENLKKWRKITKKINSIYLKNYTKNIKGIEPKNKIKKVKEILKKIEITEELIETVKNKLIDYGDSEIGMHKKIASDLNLSNKIVWKIISKIKKASLN